MTEKELDKMIKNLEIKTPNKTSIRSPKTSEDELARKKRADSELERLYELAEMAEKTKEKEKKTITISDSNKSDTVSTDRDPIIPTMKEVSTSAGVKEPAISNSPFVYVGDNPEARNTVTTDCEISAKEKDCGSTNVATSSTIEGEQKKVEKVNHPSHYNSKGKETIEILKDYLSEEEYAGFLKGNILKYIHRYEYKAGLEDLEKAKWYLEELIRRNTK